MDITPFLHCTRFKDFDDFDEYVFVQNQKSKELVYGNKAYLRLAESKTDDLPNFDERFLSLRAFPMEIEGIACIVQVARPIVPYRQSTQSHEVRLAVSDVQNILRTEMKTRFLYESSGRSYHESLIDRIVHRMMGFYGSPLAHLVMFSPKKERECTLFRYKQDQEDPKTSTIGIDPFIEEYHNVFFRKGYSLLSSDVKDFECVGDDLSKALTGAGVHSLANVPYFTEGRLSGYVALANLKRSAGHTDLFFADFATSAIGTMAYRGQLYSNMYLDDATNFPWTSSIAMFYPEYVASHKDKPIAAFEFDFLHFRVIIRTYGIAIGEAILAKTADILRAKYPNSLLARKNGTDAFVVITTDLAESLSLEAARIAEEVQSAFPDIMLTISFGIYQIKDPREEFEEALLKASVACRAAKKDPINRIAIFDEDMDKRESLAVYFINHFHSSLENGDFQVYIQPKFNLETESYFGGEALIRWKLGDIVIPPSEFLPQFEANGLSRELDLYVLKKTCEVIARWLAKSPEAAVPLSVNFSRVDFSDPHLFDAILSVIHEAGIPSSYIEIEITESAYVDYERQIIGFIQKCHAADIKVLMDDFGAGVSSFNSLKNLDIDGIKLDYKFLSDSGDNHKKRKIIEGIVAIARSINVPVVVEGIETKTEAAFFRALGVRYVQGYLFGKPMPIPQFEEISNRKAEFAFHTGDDTRMLLNDLLDTNSNINLFFDRIGLMCSVYRYDGQGLYPVLINRALEQCIASIGVVSHFMQCNLLDFFGPEERKAILEGLNRNNRAYIFAPKKRYDFHFGSHSFAFMATAMLIQREFEGNDYYLFAAEPLQQTGESGDNNDYSAEWLMQSAIQGCAIIDEDDTILAFNDFLKERYPDIEVGKTTMEIFRHKFDSKDYLHRAYVPHLELVFDVSARAIDYHGKRATVLVFSELGDPGSYISEIGGDGFKFYDRMVATCHTIAVCYVEIDLEGDSFFQINFREHDDFAYHDAINRGSFTGDLYHRFLDSVSIGDLPRIREKLELSSLVDACKAMSPFTLEYKLHGSRTYHRVSVKFYFDKGHHYACFFLEDTTQERVRDYDRLTSCLGRNAGLATMNKHILEQPLEKMAFFILDLDNFKWLNDTYGHPVGDRVLAKIRDAFRALPENYRFFTRLGGDEFCMLVSPRSEDFDPAVCRRLIAESIYDIGFQIGLNQGLGCSIGYALVPEDGDTIEAVYPKADGDLYEQKKIRKAKRIE